MNRKGRWQTVPRLTGATCTAPLKARLPLIFAAILVACHIVTKIGEGFSLWGPYL